MRHKRNVMGCVDFQSMASRKVCVCTCVCVCVREREREREGSVNTLKQLPDWYHSVIAKPHLLWSPS